MCELKRGRGVGKIRVKMAMTKVWVMEKVWATSWKMSNRIGESIKYEAGSHFQTFSVDYDEALSQPN